jgi:hypothetical protein
MIKELVTPQPNLRWISPLKDNYVAVDVNFHRDTGELDYVLVLLNTQFKKTKILARADRYTRVQFTNQPPDKAKTYLLRHLAAHTVYEDKAFMVNTQKGFYFDVFDHQGNHLYSIDKNDEVEKMKVDDAFKERLIDYVKLHDRAYYDRFIRKNFLFHAHFPAIKNFRINDKKIFVVTYKEKDGMREMIVLDLKGKILDRIFLPLKSIKLTRLVGGDTFSVSNGVLYELLENEKTEMWELFKTDISQRSK